MRKPIACTLTDADAPAQLDRWSHMRTAAESVTRLDAGVSLIIPSRHREAIDVLVAVERDCCPFLTIDVSEHPAGIELSVTADDRLGVAAVHEMLMP